MWFDTWYDVWRVVVSAVVAYVAIVVYLRLSGKRTLAKLNVFDFVVTIAVGSMLATTILSSDVTIVAGLVALAMLVLLQLVVAFVVARSRPAATAVKSRPRLLVAHGALLDEVLRQERLSVDAVYQAMRRAGVASLAEVDAMVLETDGSVSVVRDADAAAEALSNVRGWREDDVRARASRSLGT